jgi:hypothetical protein
VHLNKSIPDDIPQTHCENGVFRASPNLYGRSRGNFREATMDEVPCAITPRILQALTSSHSDLSVHVISVALFIISICGVIVHVLHQAERRELRLVLEPGTIASATYFSAESDMAAIFDGQGNEKDIRTALAGKTFRIDHSTNKITMDGGDNEVNEY